jgi:hypothetical protein
LHSFFLKSVKALASWAQAREARRALYLITDLHNSNKPTAQTTLLGEIIPEEKYSLLGFVKGDDLQIEENTWFIILNSKQINLLTDCLKEKSYL